MKKIYLRYVLWVVLFLVYQFLFFETYTAVLRYLSHATLTWRPDTLVKAVFTILGGGLFALLGRMGKKYAGDKKGALAEFIIVGVPVLYFTVIRYMSYIKLQLSSGYDLPWFAPLWLLYDIQPRVICELLLGYELVIFFMRMADRRKTTKSEINAQASANEMSNYTEA